MYDAPWFGAVERMGAELLDEARDARRFALVRDGTGPNEVHRSRAAARLPAHDHPVNASHPPVSDILKQRLGEDYPKDHAIIAYHAPTLPGMKPIVEVGTIGKIEAMNINASTTCLVRPRQVPSPDETYFDVMRERMTKAQERMKEAAG